MFGKLSARPAISFGDQLAHKFAERYPVALDKPGAPQVSANRLSRILEGLCIEAQSFRDEHRLGYYRRTRLAHAFKWRLLEFGYSGPLIDAATEALVVYLGKPVRSAPEMIKAQEKRARKASQAVEQRKDSAAKIGNRPYVNFSRSNPSPRYRELVRLYGQMHEYGESFLGIPPEQTFPGQSLLPQAVRVKRLIVETGSKRLLDYGSGKGQQYGLSNVSPPGQSEIWDNMQSFFGVHEIQCYDPAYMPYSELPRGAFDGVISTDVLEHCPEEDMDWILDEIFSYARKFVFANVACYPAKKRLPTGENAHCTIKSLKWWEEKLLKASENHPGVKYEFWVQWEDESSGLVDDVIEN